MYVKVLTKKSRFQRENAELHRRVDNLTAEAAGLKMDIAEFQRQAKVHAAEAATIGQQVEELTAKLASQTKFEMSEVEFGELVGIGLEVNDVTLAKEVVLLRDENTALKQQVAELKHEVGTLKGDIQALMAANKELITANKELERRMAAKTDAYEWRVGAKVKLHNEPMAQTVETMGENYRQHMAVTAKKHGHEVAELKRQVNTLIADNEVLKAANTEHEQRMATMAEEHEHDVAELKHVVNTLKEIWAAIEAHFPNARANVQS